ncbi:uncharacterized protein YukE [Halopolyspora algeriensis]|uniref:Uncharacterized protein YukE n=1 Tax=Halopolyspora algeriensis TaxID=1500506 RepID=A0A368VZ77_9ACTN|nr:WXG100 family type VII secretion target [Halopolyspora algeriensis]RCW46729.1 uncharacterized protein YukE [Halopolyspora algeriensis]TQM46754.1 uncharacterized protein YukE [Halopolyspora algeriensis]
MSAEAPGARVNSSIEPESEETSDFHLKKLGELENVLRHDVWGRVFKRWREHPAAAKKYPGSEYPVWGTGFTETHDIPGIEGIDWGMLNAAADSLAELAGNRRTWAEDVNSLQHRLSTAWTGKAADAAREQYAAMKAPVEDYCDAAETLGNHLKTAVRVPRELIGPGGLSDFKKRSTFWNSYGLHDQSEDMLQDIDGMEKLVSNPQEVMSAMVTSPQSPYDRALSQRIIDYGVQNFGQEHVNKALGPDGHGFVAKVDVTWEDLKLPGSPACRSTLGSDTCSCDRITWLDTFCAWYAHDVKNLRDRIHHAYERTEEAWTELRNRLEQLDADPFAKLSMGRPGQRPPRGEPAGEQAPPPAPGREENGRPPGMPNAGGGGGAGGGVSSPAGGGSVSASAAPQGSPTPTPPSMPEPPERPQSPGTPEPHGPGETGRSPEPPAVQPGGAAPAPTAGGQITVGEGPNRITVSEPGPNGEVRLSIPGEDGGPKTYEIGFGQEGLVLHQGGAGQAPAGQEFTGRAEEGKSSTAAPGTGQAVPQVPAPSAGAEGTVQVPVGPEGQAVVENGNRTITVEQTSSGELQLTVADENGSPQSYTVDFGGEGAAEPQQPYTPRQASRAPLDQPVPAGSAPTILQGGGGFSSMSGSGDEDIRNSFGSVSGTLFGPADSAAGHQWGQSTGVGHFTGGPGAVGLPSMGSDVSNSSAQGATGLASMSGSAGAAPPDEQGSAMRGGMMPMGGTGGAGGQSGGDEERTSDSPWRTRGDLFDDGVDADVAWQYRAVLGESEDE